VQLAKDLTVFDKVDSDRIRQSLLEYEQAAVAEWIEVANGRTYPRLMKHCPAQLRVRPSAGTHRRPEGSSRRVL